MKAAVVYLCLCCDYRFRMSGEEALPDSVNSSTAIEPTSNKHPSLATNGSTPTSHTHVNSLSNTPTAGSTTPTPAVATPSNKTTNPTQEVDSTVPEHTHDSRSENGGEVSRSLSETPPALVNYNNSTKNMEGEKNEMEIHESTADSAIEDAPMEVDDNTGRHSDREDSPALVIAMPSDASEEETPMISHNHTEESQDGGEMSGEEIDLNVPLEESSDEERPPPPPTNHTPHLKHTSQSSTPQTNGMGQPLIANSIESHDSGEVVKRSVSPSYRAKQVAKLKRFFTTLQGFGNKLGSEGAEQVQELILALVVGAHTLPLLAQHMHTRLVLTQLTHTHIHTSPTHTHTRLLLTHTHTSPTHTHTHVSYSHTHTHTHVSCQLTHTHTHTHTTPHHTTPHTHTHSC